MKKSVTFIVLICLTTVLAQDRYINEFEKLPSVTSIKDLGDISKWKLDATEIFDANLFYTTNYLSDNVRTSALFYRRGKDWTIYETPFGGDRMFPDFLGYSEDGQYAFFQIESVSHIARGIETDYSYFCIIDLFYGTFTDLETYYYQHHWSNSEDENTTSNSFFMSKSQIIIEGRKLTVLESDFSVGEDYLDKNELDIKFGLYDSQSGIFEIQDQKLIKTHYYDSAVKQMKPIVYGGKLAVGMVLRDIPDIYNTSYGLELKEVPRFAYGFDSEEIGYELWVSGNPLYFLIAPNRHSEIRRIEHLVLISPELTVHGLHPGMTVEAILKEHPNANLNIDLISDWEYIYLKEFDIRLIFKTDSSKRIAEYTLNEKTGDFIPTKILNKTRKVDFIKILK